MGNKYILKKVGEKLNKLQNNKAQGIITIDEVDQGLNALIDVIDILKHFKLEYALLIKKGGNCLGAEKFGSFVYLEFDSEGKYVKGEVGKKYNHHSENRVVVSNLEKLNKRELKIVENLCEGTYKNGKYMIFY